MPDQNDRIQRHHAAPHNLIDSTLYGLWGGGLARWVIGPVRKLLAYPIGLLEILPAHFAGLLLIVAAYHGPSSWAAAWGDLSVWAYILLATWGVFVLNGIDYALEVILRVPWCAPRTYPLIARVDFFPRPDRKLGWLSVLVGTVCLLPVLLFAVSHQVQPLPVELLNHERVRGNGVALATNGLVFLVFGMFQLWLAHREPAWPFVRWTQEDELIVQRQAAQIQAERPQQPLAPVTPPQHVPPHPDGQAPAQTNTAGKPGLPNDYPVPFSPRAPTKTFDDIHGMDELKNRLLSHAGPILNYHAHDMPTHMPVPRNGILLHGEPGNGKTVLAEALAGELCIAFLEVTYGPVASKWIGELPALLTRTFALARASAPCVLFIDEIDSFLKSRDAQGSYAEMSVVTNIMLTEMVALRRTGVILMGATNYLDLLDAAAVREGRFDFKIEVTPPDQTARIGLLRDGVRKHGQRLQVDDKAMVGVAKRWNGFSVARLNAVCQALPYIARTHQRTHIGHAEWMLALRAVQGQKGRLAADSRRLKHMVFAPQMRNTIDMIVSRLKNAHTTEARGGTLPTGILFHGPAGTGKTATAQAIAREANWAFLSMAGPDLLVEHGKLDKVFRQAKDLRPAIIFIDEADDLLRERQRSSRPDMVNKLLATMDGTEEKVKDLVWIAATNHPEQIDPALLRAGRFTEKLLFSPPSQALCAQHIGTWLKRRQVQLGRSNGSDGTETTAMGEAREQGRSGQRGQRSVSTNLDEQAMAKALHGQPIANVEGVLQHALNVAIDRTGDNTGAVVLEVHDFRQALQTVIGHA